MLHELLVALAGLPSDLFVPFPPPPLVPNTLLLRADFPHLHPAERAAYDRLARIGFWARELAHFTDSELATPLTLRPNTAASISATPPPFGTGCYSHALARGVRAVLDDYLDTLDEIETAVLDQSRCGGSTSGARSNTNAEFALADADGYPRTPLTSLLVALAVPALVLEVVALLVRTYLDSRHAYFGAKALDLVLPRLLDGRADVARAMRTIAHQVLAVFFNHLSGFLMHADAFDPIGEFFLVPQKKQGKEEVLEPFRIESTLVPRSLVSDAVVQSILFTATSSYIVQRSPRGSDLITRDMWNNQLQILTRLLDLESELRPLDLELAMDMIRRDYTRALWQIMVVDEKLADYMSAIHLVMLGGNGDLLSQFLQSVELVEHRSVAIGSLGRGMSERELNALYRTAVQRVLLGTEMAESNPVAAIVASFKYSVQASNPLDASDRLGSPPFRTLAPPPPPLPHSSAGSTTPTPVVTTVPGQPPAHARLTLAIPWPLSLMLTTAVLDQYAQVHATLLHIARVRHALDGLHASLRAITTPLRTPAGSSGASIGRVARRAAAARVEATSVLGAISEAVSAVVAGATTDFLDKLGSADGATDDLEDRASVADWQALASRHAQQCASAVLAYPPRARAARDALAKVLAAADGVAAAIDVATRLVDDEGRRARRTVDAAEQRAGGDAGRTVAGRSSNLVGGLAGAASAAWDGIRTWDEAEVLVARAANEFHSEAKFFYRVLEGARGSGATIVKELLIRLDFNKHWTLGPLRRAHDQRRALDVGNESDEDERSTGRDPWRDHIDMDARPGLP